MSVIINGNPEVVTTPLTATIVSAVSGGGVTTCTTSAPHLFGTDDYVSIAGATGMTGLNATWLIAVTGSTTFTVPSALSGSYGASSATATDYALTPQFQWPSDGDPGSAQLSGLISGATMLASYCQFLQREVRLLQLVQPEMAAYLLSILPLNDWSANQSGSWGTSYANNTTGSNGPVLIGNVVGVNTNDFIDVSLSGTVFVESTGGSGAINRINNRLEYSTGASTTTPLTSSEVLQTATLTTNTIESHVLSLSFGFFAPGPGTYVLWLNGLYAATGSFTGIACGPSAGSAVVRVWRSPNS